MPNTSTIPHRDWAIADTGDYAKDCRAGRKAADRVIRYIRETGFTPALGVVAQAIAARGRWGGVEIGYFSRLAEMAT